MTYQRATCFYASGTGNSFRAASWLAQAIHNSGGDATLVPVEKASEISQTFTTGQLVAIYHPAHGLMPPWSMIRFLLFTLKRGNGAHGVVVSTRGGIPLGKVLIPGGSGMALFFPLLVLLLKGYKVRGGMGIDMPCNVLNVHWGVTPSSAARTIEVGQGNHRYLENALLAGEPYFRLRNLLWELLWCIPFVVYPLLPLVYLLVSRVFMAKLMFADHTCKQCGACARRCPRGAIHVSKRKSFSLFWTHHCEACMRCMGFCRHKSIQASHLWAVGAAYLTSWTSATQTQSFQSTYLPMLPQLPDWMVAIFSFTVTFVTLLLLYYLFYTLVKLPLFKTLFTYTTFTKLYRRRYHEPQTRARELTKIIKL